VLRSIARGADGDIIAVGTTGSADMAVAAFAGSPIADYASGSTDWDQGLANGMFGACLYAVGGGASAVWGASASCPQSDGAMWRPLPSALDTVATAPASVVTASVDMRFGIRAGTTQSPGTYEAPITFEVVAP
jgi:hypothetical protein